MGLEYYWFAWPKYTGNGYTEWYRNIPDRLFSGNGQNYIMVALADWYILPIVLQLGKLSGPQDGHSYYWQCPKLFTEYFKLLVQLK